MFGSVFIGWDASALNTCGVLLLGCILKVLRIAFLVNLHLPLLLFTELHLKDKCKQASGFPLYFFKTSVFLLLSLLVDPEFTALHYKVTAFIASPI